MKHHAVGAALAIEDADFLDTEAHFEGDERGKRYRESGPVLEPWAALAALRSFVNESIRAASEAHTEVREVREALWQAATDSARNRWEYNC